MPKLTKKLISNDVPSNISFTPKGALHLPTAPCTFQNLAGTLNRELLLQTKQLLTPPPIYMPY